MVIVNSTSVLGVKRASEPIARECDSPRKRARPSEGPARSKMRCGHKRGSPGTCETNKRPRLGRPSAHSSNLPSGVTTILESNWADSIRASESNSDILRLARGLIANLARGKSLGYLQNSGIHRYAVKRLRSDAKPSKNRADFEKFEGKFRARTNAFKLLNSIYETRPRDFVQSFVDGKSVERRKFRTSSACKFYREIYGSTEIDPDLTDLRANVVDYEKLITPDELETAIMGSDSSPGPDGVSKSEIKKWVKTEPLEAVSFFNILILSRELPSSLKRAKLTLIPKVEGAKLDQTRPISVVSHLYRVYLAILCNRLSPVVASTIDTRQLGLNVAGGAQLGHLMVKKCLYTAQTMGRDIGVISLDCRKAFDRISRRKISEKLLSMPEIPKSLAHNVIATLHGTSIVYAGAGGATNSFAARSGVPQGSPLSALLFVLGTVDAFKRAFNANSGFALADTKVTGIAYLDDLTIIGKNGAAALETAAKVREELGHVGLQLNESKSQIVALKRISRRTKKVEIDTSTFVLGDQHIEALKEGEDFRLLGAKIHAKSKSIKEEWDELKRKLKGKLSHVCGLQLATHHKLDLLLRYIIPSFFYNLGLLETTRSAHRIRKCRYTEQVDRIIDTTIRRLFHLSDGQRFKETVKLAKLPQKYGGLGFPNLEQSHCSNRVQLFGSAERVFGDKLARILIPDIESAKIEYESKRTFTQRNLEAVRALPGLKWLHESLNHGKFLRCREERQALSGGRMIRFFKMKSNLLSTRECQKRKRQTNSARCRHCDAPNETITHLLGSCRSRLAHEGIVRRHNAVYRRFERMLKCRPQIKYLSEVEVIGNEAGQRVKPDGIMITPTTTWVVEFGIHTEIGDPSARFETIESKAVKYEKPWIYERLHEMGIAPRGRPVKCVSIIVGARGTFTTAGNARGYRSMCKELRFAPETVLSTLAQTSGELSLRLLDALLR
ncbi:unnamed protein product [Oikopleura dioica]|uniref:Reverse transcriptase domain-containing protein n=1 Tax=Oikopleura dioica TaxID=34765 RepID=E4YX28_OIKDI|nr:unnamed protein product [Oikopleura dioica]